MTERAVMKHGTPMLTLAKGCSKSMTPSIFNLLVLITMLQFYNFTSISVIVPILQRKDLLLTYDTSKEAFSKNILAL